VPLALMCTQLNGDGVCSGLAAEAEHVRQVTRDITLELQELAFYLKTWQ
jgi:hypothetical protein